MFLLQEEYDSISVIYMRFDCNIMLYHKNLYQDMLKLVISNIILLILLFLLSPSSLGLL